MDRVQVWALSDKELAEHLRKVDDVENFHYFVTEALARILIGRQWFAAVPADSDRERPPPG